MKNIGKENFDQEVMQAQKPVLLDFFAPWCGPCQMVGPILEEIAAERPDIQVCKVNVDEEQELAARFRVMSVPTLMVVKNGEIVKRVSGTRSKEELLEML